MDGRQRRFRRTKKEQEEFPAETADSQTLVQIAIVYSGNQITIFRNGSKYADYTAAGAERFDSDSLVLMGLRHRDAGRDNCWFVGSIDDARIYGVALSAEQIAALKPNQPSDPQPLAWWDFEGGKAGDRMQLFPTSTLFGDARIADGRLHLDANGAYLWRPRRLPNPSIDLSNANSAARALREKLLSDPYRPGYHFVTPEGSCMPFDPNGAIYWKGRYHLFYIFQDARGHNWGHVSSTDLFHWRHHPTGLVSGMFSGNCFVNKDGRPTMCYHQVGQGNAMAVAIDDELNEWKKLDSNPITPKTEPGDPHHEKYRSWDPYGWLEGNTYYAIFGGKRPAIAKSDSLAGPWKYVGDLLANSVEGVSIDEDVSCADFFQLGDQRMLLCISHRLGCRYYLGDWKNEQFHPTFHQQMSWVDNSFFAPESLLDDQGRRIMWAWIFDSPGFAMRSEYGWSGTMSLPRVLSLGEDGMLRMNPPAEIEQTALQRKEADRSHGAGRLRTATRRHRRQQPRIEPGHDGTGRQAVRGQGLLLARRRRADARLLRRDGEETQGGYHQVKPDGGAARRGGRPSGTASGRTAQAAHLRGQVGRRSVCQRAPGGDATHLSIAQGQRRRGGFLAGRPGPRRHARGVGHDAVESVLSTIANVCTQEVVYHQRHQRTPRQTDAARNTLLVHAFLDGASLT